MASSFLRSNFCSLSIQPSTLHTKSTIPFTYSKFLSNSFKLKTRQIGKLKIHRSRSLPVVYAAQNNFLKVWKVGRDGIEAGTNLVPDSIPKPIARISVTIVALTVTLFLLKSVLSTAFFVLAMMGAIYFIFIALNKDEGPRGGGGGGTSSSSTDETLEEARRIMEKYK